MDEELVALGRAAVAVFSEQQYEKVKMSDIGRSLPLPRTRGRPTEREGRSHTWVYNKVGSRGCAAVLAGLTAWETYRSDRPHADEPVRVDTLTAARKLVVGAFAYTLGFAAAERPLLANVLRGVRDLTTEAKGTPLADDPDIGPVIAAAERGVCALFAAWLAPVLAEACSPVLRLNARDLRTDAEDLSHLLLAKSVDGRASVPVQAHALWNYWFTLRIVGSGGPAVEQRERAEYEVYRGERCGSPLTRLAGTLLAGRQDLPASGAAFARAAADSRARGRWADACDAASRGGLAYLYAGDWTTARRLFGHSLDLARDHLSADDPRIARAMQNQAEVLARSGRPDMALAMIRQAIQRRRREAGDAGRRHLRLSERVQVLAMAEHGYVASAVREAARLAASGESTDLRLYGRVLRQAGRPREALEVLRRAEDAEGTPVPGTRRHLETLADEARCLLALARPDQAQEVLDPVVSEPEWHARRLSARLTFEIVTLSAQAARLRLEHGAALETLRRFRSAAAGWGAFPADDPLFDEFGRALGQCLLFSGKPKEARAELAVTLKSQQRRVEAGRLYEWHPALAATRLELGECDEAEHLPETAARHYGWIAADRALDPGHPLRLAAVLGLTRLALARNAVGDAVAAMRTLPAACDWPLEPGIELTEEASRLASRLRRLTS